jgi:hypothetical protein
VIKAKKSLYINGNSLLEDDPLARGPAPSRNAGGEDEDVETLFSDAGFFRTLHCLLA